MDRKVLLGITLSLAFTTFSLPASSQAVAESVLLGAGSSTAAVKAGVCPEFVTEPKQQAARRTHSAASIAATANKHAAEREKLGPEKSNGQHSRS